MVGSASSPPLWTGDDWRPILGTSVDTRILPPPLSDKESLLLLSQWIRLPRDDLHIKILLGGTPVSCSYVAIVSFGYKLSKTILMMSPFVFLVAN